MAGAPAIPSNFLVQTSNQQVLVSWDLTVGADSYVIQRSLDNITFVTVSTIAGSPLVTNYLDTAVTLGIQYWYQVQAVNVSGSSAFTNTLSAIPTPTGELTLSQIKLMARQRADRVNSQFVTENELRGYINQAMYELYDLLITVYEDLYVAAPIQFVSDGVTYLYALPNGSNTFLNALNLNETITPKPFYKLLGLDLQIQNTNNGYVTLNKFNFIDRNRFVYPNTSSSIYGVFNMKYRVMGKNIEFIPTPSSGQGIRVWYIPRLTELLLETDTTDIGISGWLEYVIVRTAKYILDKEETDTQIMTQEIVFLKARIEESAANRDAGQPDTISNTRSTGWGWGEGGGGFNGSSGGY